MYTIIYVLFLFILSVYNSFFTQNKALHVLKIIVFKNALQCVVDR